MKKLLVLLTAPLTMTACIDLTEPDTGAQVPGQNPGSDAETEDKLKGFALARFAYANTDFVQPFESTDVLASAGVTAQLTNSCADINSLKGQFDVTAAASSSGSEIMTSREGIVNIAGDNENGFKLGETLNSVVESETPFFESKTTSNGAHWTHSVGYIATNVTGDNDDVIDMTTHEYASPQWYLPTIVTNQTVVRLTEDLTQIWTKGQVSDAIQLTDSIYANRVIRDSGNQLTKTISVFNINTDETYELVEMNDGTIVSENMCNITGSSFQEYVDRAKEISIIGRSDEDFSNVDITGLFADPTFEHTKEEIEAKFSE